MAEVLLYIAASLDGYIARRDGGIDWLSTVETGESDHGYESFYQSVDSLVMGSKTYEQALSFGEWPYPDKPSYVFTRRSLTSERKDVIFTSLEPDRVISKIRAQGYKKIWLVGGSELISTFQRLGLIDEYIVSIVPYLLGEGIPLFLPPGPEEKMKLVEHQAYPTGLVQLRYRRREGA